MLKKKTKPPPLGMQTSTFCDTPAEGIFGLLPATEELNVEKEVRKLFQHSRGPVGRSFFGWMPEHHMTPVHLKAKQQSAKLDRSVKVKKKSKKKVVAAQQIIPGFDINYASELPSEYKNLDLRNAVKMDEKLLRTIIDSTEFNTKELSNIMLQRITPAVLSFDASSSYVKAVLSSGLKIDTEIDRGVAEVVQDLARLEVVTYYVNKMGLAERFKRRLLRKFIDGFSERSMEALKKADKGAAMSQQMRELEGVLVRNSERQKKQEETHGQRKQRERNGGRADPSEIAIPDSTRRSRKDVPRYGGF